MQLGRSGIIGLVLVGTATIAAAQDAPAPDGRVDVSRLPLDLGRIQRELRESEVRDTGDGLILRYQVEVFGRLPELQLFTPEDNLANGPVPYGAPTHRQIIEHITPREFRSPVMDFNSLFRWLAEKTKN